MLEGDNDNEVAVVSSIHDIDNTVLCMYNNVLNDTVWVGVLQYIVTNNWCTVTKAMT